MIERKHEIVAPLGHLKNLKRTLDLGADAVYAGLQGFSSRPKEADLSIAEIAKATKICAKHGKKIYVAINAWIQDKTPAMLSEAIQELDGFGIDAIIVSDFGLLRTAARLNLRSRIHISTLAGLYNYQGAKLMKEYGVSRIILSSDLFLDEIAALIDGEKEMEYEIIADGGICFNSNRQCLLPHVGRADDYCVGCQMEYRLIKNEEEEPSYGIGSIPIRLGETIGLYIALGITSFKMEGRTNEFDYICKRLSMLRRNLDDALQDVGKTEQYMHYIRKKGGGMK